MVQLGINWRRTMERHSSFSQIFLENTIDKLHLDFV